MGAQPSETEHACLPKNGIVESAARADPPSARQKRKKS